MESYGNIYYISNRVKVDDDDSPDKKREAPMFIMKPEPQKVYEGDWAKFWCRVMGNPNPRVTWIVNGHHIIPVSINKLLRTQNE